MPNLYEIKAAKKLRQGTKEVWPGSYRGKVESIDDPDRLGRVKVRVWAIHGDGQRTPTSALPWAEIAESGGGGYDFGSFDPPPVGASVWVTFECGDCNFPVIFGTSRGVPKRDAENPNIFLTNDGKPEVETPWTPPDEGLETPKDVFDCVYSGDPHPTRRVWKKSYKGHTILIEDGDGKEFLKIIDRAGQVIEMDCPVEKDISKGNGAQRGTRDSTRGDQLSHNALKNRRAFIRIKDLSGQEIILDAKDADEKIIIRGRNRLGSTENKITLSSGKGNDYIEIEDTGGDTIRLDPRSNQPIVIKDSAGNALIFDKNEGKVKIVSSKISEEQVPQKNLVVSGRKYSSIDGDEEKDIKGNKISQIVGDAAAGIMGNTSLSLGGALKMLITNMSPNGIEEKALDIAVVNATKGNVNVSTTCPIGDIKLETLGAKGDIILNVAGMGNIEETTTKGDITVGVVSQGNVTVGTNLGDVKVQTSAGQASLSTVSGQANVDGTTVHLGTLAAAIQPLIKGQVFVSGLGPLLTALNSAGASAQGVSLNPAPNPVSNALAIAAIGTALIGFASGMTSLMSTILSTKVFTE